MWRSALAGLCALVAACERDWRTDMWYQPAPQARDTPRVEPAGSVPLFARAEFLEREDATALRPPFVSDGASIERGRVLFLDRCAGCHNTDGRGNGPVSRFFPPAPDLAFSTIRAKSDGYLFATVALGGRAMPPMGEGLDDRDRWDLVRFVRHVQATSPVVAPPAEGGR
jgi:mono/diheme cytochrome c family protein